MIQVIVIKAGHDMQLRIARSLDLGNGSLVNNQRVMLLWVGAHGNILGFLKTHWVSFRSRVHLNNIIGNSQSRGLILSVIFIFNVQFYLYLLVAFIEQVVSLVTRVMYGLITLDPFGDILVQKIVL